MSESPFRFASPDQAIAALLERLRPVSAEPVDLAQVQGRVLAEPLIADRDSPPCDVSQLDGYAVRLADLGSTTPLPVAGEVRIGQPAPALPAGAALRIVTGAPVPAGAQGIIRREDWDEQHADCVTLRVPPHSVRPGQDIRRRGENLRAGQTVLPAGTFLDAPAVGALSSFGAARIHVARRIRAAIVVTGDEILPADSQPQPWQIRDANGPALHALLLACPRVTTAAPIHVPDLAERLQAALASAMQTADLVLLTGGVSMGQYDHVPAVVQALGAQVIFHKLPLRPGKPILAAVGPGGQAILGLPGNPVSVLTTACRFAGAVIRHLSGTRPASSARPGVALEDPDATALPLWWSRPVCLTGSHGTAKLLCTRGSGDIVAAARSGGFLEIPPGQHGPGPWPFYRWEL